MDDKAEGTRGAAEEISGCRIWQGGLCNSRMEKPGGFSIKCAQQGQMLDSLGYQRLIIEKLFLLASTRGLLLGVSIALGASSDYRGNTVFKPILN